MKYWIMYWTTWVASVIAGFVGLSWLVDRLFFRPVRVILGLERE